MAGKLVAKPYLPAPTTFNGSVGEFFERYCKPNLISKADMDAIHQELCSYAGNERAILFIREVTGLNRQRAVGEVRSGLQVAGRMIAGTDNSPAWFLHSAARSSCVPRGQAFEKWMMEEVPCHIFAVNKAITETMNAKGWHAAHIVNAKDGNTDFSSWSDDELRRRFLRSVHPINIAMVPESLRKSHGGRSELLGYFIARYREIFGPVWDSFVAALSQPFSMPTPWDGREDFSYAAKAVSDGGELSGTPRRTIVSEMTVLAWRASRLHFKATALDELRQDESLAGIRVIIEATSASAANGYRNGFYFFPREQAILFMAEKENTKAWASEGWHAPRPPDRYKVWFHEDKQASC